MGAALRTRLLLEVAQTALLAPPGTGKNPPPKGQLCPRPTTLTCRNEGSSSHRPCMSSDRTKMDLILWASEASGGAPMKTVVSSVSLLYARPHSSSTLQLHSQDSLRGGWGCPHPSGEEMGISRGHKHGFQGHTTREAHHDALRAHGISQP